MSKFSVPLSSAPVTWEPNLGVLATVEHDRGAGASVNHDTGAVTASAIYEGTVRHRRFAVRSHEFCQRLALAYIDLDELPGLLGGRLLARGPGLVRFRRRDYLGDARIPLPDAVRDTVEAQTGVRPHGPIRLLTNLSALGHCFNPVSFYYCMDPLGEQLEAVVAEVTNTPWGESHSYVLGADGPEKTSRSVSPASDAGEKTSRSVSPASDAGEKTSRSAPPAAAGVLAGGFAKVLHVSPFMGMDHRYEWRITVPAHTLSVHISSSREGRIGFDATLSLRRQELTSASLARLTATTLRTLPSIYKQAALLKLKGVPVHAHTGVDVA